LANDQRSDEADPAGSPRTPVAVLTMDCAGILLDLNPTAELMFGYARDEAIGRRLSELIIPKRLRRAHEAGLRRYTETGEAPLLDAPYRLPALRRDGRELEVELVVSRVRHHGVEAFVGFAREATAPAPVQGELRLRADFFRALVEHSPNLVAVLDEGGRAGYASAAALSLFGADGWPASGRYIDEYAHPDDRAHARDAVQRALAGKLTEPVEFRLRDRDGVWRAVSVSARDLRGQPPVTGTVLYAADTTRARAAERRERVEYTRLMTLVESLKVGVLVQDEQGRVVLSNSTFVELFEQGATRADEVVQRNRPVFGDEVILRDGRVVERDYVPIMLDGSALGHLWVFRDVTAQTEARRTLEERNRILTELSALKTDFVAVLSHELRTPLTSIATFAGMLDVAAELDPTEYRSAVGAIQRNAERLMALVEDLVLLARLESRELAPGSTPVDVATLLRATAPAGAGPVPDGPPIRGDEALLRELLETAFGVVASADTGAGGLELDASCDDAGWRIRIHAETTEPATTERLLSSRLPHPRHPGENRTGALALMLARAIADRHDGHLATVVGPTAVTVTITLPATAENSCERTTGSTPEGTPGSPGSPTGSTA